MAPFKMAALVVAVVRLTTPQAGQETPQTLPHPKEIMVGMDMGHKIQTLPEAGVEVLLPQAAITMALEPAVRVEQERPQQSLAPQLPTLEEVAVVALPVEGLGAAEAAQMEWVSQLQPQRQPIPAVVGVERQEVVALAAQAPALQVALES
jgi:hypothetical protein